ncbi:MAG: lysophospholipid acyltransferase family protein [Planctomycetes bacterium]|nr:lysophospholipid acyltransferase family protein [Planctomycetota bacterium]
MTAPAKLIDIETAMPSTTLRRAFQCIKSPVEKALSIDSLNKAYLDTKESSADNNYFDACLKNLGVSLNYSENDLKNIPTTGPLIIVANHPFGALEAIIIASLINKVRSDVKILGNHFLSLIQEIEKDIIPVDAFKGREAMSGNGSSLRSMMRWLKDEKSVIAFPAGEVSSFSIKKGKIEDPPWNTHIASIAQRTKATVLPIYFNGNNSMLFQALGLVHSSLRTIMLPRELMNKSSKGVDLCIGKAIGPGQCAKFSSPEDLAHYMRVKTYILKLKKPNSPQSDYTVSQKSLEDVKAKSQNQPISEEVSPVILQHEVETLGEECLLLEKGLKHFWIFTAKHSSLNKSVIRD